MNANHYFLQDKVVLVTGAGTGIGRAIARGFLDNGAKVAVSGRRERPLAETVSGYSPSRVLIAPSDISDPRAARRLVADVIERFGRLDVVVSNAALYEGGDIAELEEARWHALFATNVDGLFYLVQQALPHLVASCGNLVAVSSVSGQAGDWDQAAYNASKHAVNGLVRSMALDYGAKGVRMNAVAPAFTLTDMTVGVGRSEEDLSPFVNRVALGRPGLPQDVVGPVLFLASNDASYITGTVLTVDGGTSASTGQPHR